MGSRFRGACLPCLLLVLSGLAAGCTSGDSTLYPVRVKVTFRGQPVPAGWVVFTPDTSKQNTGPQGFAAIKDGVFDTTLPMGKGTQGGPMIVKIDGCDGQPTSDLPCGKPIMAPYEMMVTLPPEPTTIDLEVPASWATQKIPVPIP